MMRTMTTLSIGLLTMIGPWVVVGCAAAAAGPTPGAELHVSTHGRDSDSGSADKPFATLERARDAIRELKERGPLPAGGVTVWLHGGVYELGKTLDLGHADSGTKDAPVVYRAVAGEAVRISGGRQIPASAFKPVADEAVLARLDPAAKGKVLMADLKALGITDVGRLEVRGFGHALTAGPAELFFNDQPMTLARWPNGGFAHTGKVLDSGVQVLTAGQPGKPEDPAARRGTFVFANERIKRWAGASDVWLYGYYCWDWADEYLPVQSIDVEKQAITLGRAHRYGLKDNKRFRVLNLLEELDQAGEWYIDRKAALLYLWPPEPIDKARVVLSMLAGPLVAMTDCSFVTLRGLTLEAGRASGVRILNGSDNLVAGCTVRNLGTKGVHIGDVFCYDDTVKETRGGQRNGVHGCDIYHTGDGAIVLGGGDRKTLTSGGNYAVNNDLHDFGRVSRTYHVGVDVNGVGQRVAHNHIHHAPHIGVFFWGNDHVMEFNDVHHLCQETADAGAFYIGRDWSMRGNVIRHNYIHDIGRFAASREFSKTMGVYLDDFASGTTVTGNVIVKAVLAIMIGGGHDNVLDGNLLIDCGTAVQVDARGRGWARSYFDGRDKILTRRIAAVNYQNPPYSERYPSLTKVLEGNPAQPKGTRIVNNVCVASGWLDLRDGVTSASAGVGDNFMAKTVAEAGFVAPEKGDYRMKDDSAVLTTLPGFRRIPFEKIGLCQDEYRTLTSREEPTTQP